jgi:hypothetical protein
MPDQPGRAGRGRSARPAAIGSTLTVVVIVWPWRASSVTVADVSTQGRFLSPAIVTASPDWRFRADWPRPGA